MNGLLKELVSNKDILRLKMKALLSMAINASIDAIKSSGLKLKKDIDFM